MDRYHYLGALPKIGNTVWYVAASGEQWLALLSFSAAALKCSARDQWIGWSYRHQYDRLNLVANNSRFLILPGHHHNNLASKILSHCRRRIQNDWKNRFGYPLLLLETFVDPERFHGTIYRASNWVLAGSTKGYRRTREGYSDRTESSKLVFVQPLQRNTRLLLSRPLLNERYYTGKARMKITANQMLSLYDFFTEIDDPRRDEGKRHQMATILSLSAAAILCGMRGYKDISIWVKALGQKARSRFRCRKRDGKYYVPSRSVIRSALVNVNPEQLDEALNAWNRQYGTQDESLAIDGKTMCNAINNEGLQTHIMSAIGHQSSHCYTQKKVGTLPVAGSDEEKQTNEIKMAAPMLDAIEIEGRTITADALLTQRDFARYLVDDRGANYHFTAKGNQAELLSDIALYFKSNTREADFVQSSCGEHGRIETRKIWVTSALNSYLNFPHVHQSFMIERESIDKKSGEKSDEIIHGITSASSEQASAEQVLRDNRGHWRVESTHYIIDWNYDEDRSQIRTGFGPENITRLRRFAIGLLKAKKGNETIPEKMKKLLLNTRAVFDCLKMSRNSSPISLT